MASSNKNWPSMFKSKPCNPHQWQQDINSPLISTGCHRAPATAPGSEERTPEPKPRWNPKPEQIRILEAIFNSGMVNPPRDEIRKIRVKLQEYGQVGDANVFYWFQNRKSRSKHKQRHLQTVKAATVGAQQNLSPPPTVNFIGSTPTMIAPSSSSSSSEKSSPNSAEHKGLTFFSNSPTASINQHQHTFFQTPNEFLAEPFFYPQAPAGSDSCSGASFTQGFYFPDVSGVSHASDLTIGNSSGLLPTKLMGLNPSKRYGNEKINLHPQLGCATVTSLPSTTTATTTTSHSILPLASSTVPSTLHHFQGVGDVAATGVGPAKSTVFINEVAFEVAVGPFNVREAFGDDAVLVHSFGQPVITNEWGVTLHPLQHGAFYYLVRTSTPSPHDAVIDLI